jgi:hypothetical protein
VKALMEVPGSLSVKGILSEQALMEVKVKLSVKVLLAVTSVERSPVYSSESPDPGPCRISAFSIPKDTP